MDTAEAIRQKIIELNVGIVKSTVKETKEGSEEIECLQSGNKKFTIGIKNDSLIIEGYSEMNIAPFGLNYIIKNGQYKISLNSENIIGEVIEIIQKQIVSCLDIKFDITDLADPKAQIDIKL